MVIRKFDLEQIACEQKDFVKEKSFKNKRMTFICHEVCL